MLCSRRSLNANFNSFLFEFSIQIFDASTNTWKVVDERSHTDFVEKIVEAPRETVIIDDITDITKIKNINDRTEKTTDIIDITNISNKINVEDNRITTTDIENLTTNIESLVSHI